MKWKKPKDSKSLQEKAAYGKIKKTERITKWTNVAYPDRDGAELEKEWEKKKTRMFAKFCWENLGTKAPSGRLWEDVFREKAGIDLVNYVSNLTRKKL